MASSSQDDGESQMAHDLADELHEWASSQQTVRTKGANGAR